MTGHRLELPFSLSRNERRTLSEQLADGIRRAIAAGHYRPGDVLPTLHELSAALGVSLRIPREAMAKLMAEGVVNPRQSVGAVVLERGSKVWRGNVLLISNGCDFSSYSEERFAAEFRNRLYQGRCLCSHFSFPADETVRRFDYSALEVILRQPIDLCVVRWGDARLYRLLEKFGIPFVALAKRRPRSAACRGVIRVEGQSAVAEEVARACQAVGVRRMAYFDYDQCEVSDMLAGLSAYGVEIERCILPLDSDRERLEAVAYGALKGMRDYLKRRRRNLPDLLYFSDDYLAKGALAALLEADIDVPRETRVLSLTNRGHMPVWTKGLARIEVDNGSLGRSCAEYALSILDGVTDPPSVPRAMRFIPDETFPIPQ